MSNVLFMNDEANDKEVRVMSPKTLELCDAVEAR